LTAGRWSWKSKSAKKCVTTYLPNGPALKIDGAETFSRNATLKVKGRYTALRKPLGVGANAKIVRKLGGDPE